MADGFFIVLLLVGLFAFAAALLWGLERIATEIGGRYAWILVLVVFPFLLAIVLAFANREKFEWWQLVAIPLAAPPLAIAALAVCAALISPADTIAAVYIIFKAGVRRLQGK